MKNISLYFKEGSSNKEYHIKLVQSNGGFLVNFHYGRVGNALQNGSKTQTPVSLKDAEKIYDKLLKEKRAKGYSEGVNKNEFSEAIPADKKTVHILPQLLNPIEDVEEYINDDEWIAQPKYDGERRLLISSEVAVMGLNKKGTEVSLPNSIVKSITNICILDGEIIGNIIYVYDILSIDNRDLKTNSCESRIAMLESLEFGEGIKVVETAYTKEEKRKLFERLKVENKEGIVFKKKNSPYTHGRPSSFGNQLKYKFYKSSTFIVANQTKGKRSVGLELVSNEGKRVPIGKVTIPVSYNIPNIGDLVEVRYLYCFRGGCVYQPIYLGKRNDSDITDATMNQLIYKEDT